MSEPAACMLLIHSCANVFYKYHSQAKRLACFKATRWHANWEVKRSEAHYLLKEYKADNFN